MTAKKTTDINLPVPITDAKIMLSFSTLHKLYYITKNYFISSLLLQDHILKFHRLFDDFFST